MPIWLPQEWCSSFVLTLGHFVWQGTLIAVLLAMTLRAVKSAGARYWLSLAALLVMAACPMVTLGWLMQPVSPVVELDPPPVVREEPAPSQPVIPAASEVASDVEQVSNLPVSPPVASLEFNATATIPPVPADPRSWWQRFSPHLTTAYLSGVAVMLLRLVAGLWGGRRLRRRVRLIDDPSLLAATQRQATALGLKLLPILAYCERVTVPTVVGVLKPMILLPLTLTSGLSPEQIESVLAHELAHLRRYDHLVNLLQRVIESLLFFHPAMWWVSHRVREEREHCCDDLVVACGAMPLDYAKSLLVVAELSRASQLRRSVAAVSLLATGNQKPSNLRQRIARLLGESTETPSLRLSPRVLTLSAVVVLAGLAVLLQSVASDDQAASSDDDDMKPPPLEFRIAITEEERMTDDVAWFPIIKPNLPPPVGKSGLDLPIEAKHDDQWRGLLWDNSKVALLADGTWKVVKSDIVKAAHSTDAAPRFDIHLTLDAEGGALMRRLTAAHLTQKMAILVDGKIIAAPVLRSEIGESCVITGDFSKASAEKLATAIRRPYRGKPSSEKKATKISAKLPNGVEVELAGVAMANVSYPDLSQRRKADAWWRADGTRLQAPPMKLFSSWVDESQKDFREFAIKLTPARDATSITASLVTWTPSPHRGSSGAAGWDTSDGQPGFLKLQHSAGFKDEKPVAVHVFVSDQPLGPAWLIDVNGLALPQKPADAKTESLRKLIQIVGVEKSGNETIFRSKRLPAELDQRLEFNLRAIDQKDQPHASSESRGSEAGEGRVFKLAAGDIKYFEIRLRPMTQKVTFENVSLQPGQKTDVKVTTSRPNAADEAAAERVAWDALATMKVSVYGEAAHQQSLLNHLRQLEKGDFPEKGLQEIRQQLQQPIRDADLWNVPAEAWPHVGRLLSLRQLSIVASDLRGKPMEEIGRLRELRRLVVTNSKCQPQDLASLRRLTELEHLEVMFTVFDETAAWRKEQLGELSEAERELADRVTATHPNREHILQAAILTDRALEALRDHKRLRTVKLINTFISSRGVRALSTLPALEELELGVVDESPDVVRLVGGMRSLKGLSGLSLTDETLAEWTALTQLEVLERHAGGVTDHGVEQLLKFASLRKLVLWHSQLTDAGLERLAELPHLESLDVRFSKSLSNAGVERFQKRNPNCKVAFDSAVSLKSQHYVANLPDGLKVEFVGMTRNTAPARDGWRPDGRRMGEVPEFKVSLGGPILGGTFSGGTPPEDTNARDFLFEFQGLRRQPSINFELPFGMPIHAQDPIQDSELRVRVFASLRDKENPFPDGASNPRPHKLRVGLTDERWGTWQQFSATGERLNQLGENDLHRSSYSQIQFQRVGPSPRFPDDTLLVLRHPKQHHRLYAFEMRGFDADGEEIQRLDWRNRAVEGTELEESGWYLTQPLPKGKRLARFEYRLRPYRHWVTFENVSLVPAQMTDVKVKTQSLPDENSLAGRGSPDPALDPTAGLPNSDEKTNSPINANGDLRSNPAAGSGDPRRAQELVKPAIERGIAFLKTQQQESGAWPGTPADGVTALCAAALLQAGVKPDEPVIQKTLATMRKVEPTFSYTVALQTMVFCMASPKEDAERIRRNVTWLEQAQATEGPNRGAWSYAAKNAKSGDGSCSRFAMLGLHAAKRAGFEVKAETWRNASDYYLSSKKPGSHVWGYTPEAGPTPTMTLAAMAGLAILNQHLPQDEQTKRRTEAIERAVPYVEATAGGLWNAGHGFYSLHGAERAAHLNRWTKFGKHELSKLLDEKLMELQNQDGSWAYIGGGFAGFGGGGEQTKEQKEAAATAARLERQQRDLIATSFALLALTGQPPNGKAENEKNPRAGRGSPDPALDPTAGLPNSDGDSKTTNAANGDSRRTQAPSAVPPALSFAETTELVLSMNSLKFMLDFDSGRTMDPPQKDRPEQKKMDVCLLDARPNEVPAGLQGMSLRGVRTKPDGWFVSVAELQKELASERVGALTKLPYDNGEKATYYFRTADGTEGILQLLAQTDEPKGIRLRYKTFAASKLNAEIKVGMTFDELIALKGRHYRLSHGMREGNLILVYDDIAISVDEPRSAKGVAKVTGFEPGIPREVVQNVPYADEQRVRGEEKFAFPYFLPGSRIVVGEDLVDEANALASKEEQIQFLLKALPPSDQKEKRLSDRQLYAIRLLSLTDSDLVIDPLLDRLDFQHKGDGWPASHALGRLGERSVEPVVKKMESVANDLQKAIMLGNALIEIKQKKYPLFLEELRQRKDNKLPDKLLNQLLEVYQLAPND